MSGLIDHLQSKTNRQHQILVRARTELLNMKKIKGYGTHFVRTASNRIVRGMHLQVFDSLVLSEIQELKEENERLKTKLQEWESAKFSDRQEHEIQKSREKTKLSSGKRVDKLQETSTMTKKLRSHTDNHAPERGDKAARYLLIGRK